MSYQTSIIQIPSNQKSSHFPQYENSLLILGVSLIPTLFVLLMIFIFFKHHNYQKALYNKSLHFKRLSENPCFNCKYFSNNQEFYCAVQPAIVLTSQAVDCQDYSPKYTKYLISQGQQK